MNQQIEIEVIDKDGWKKTFPIQKNIFHIGSSVANDVVLEANRGAGVSARHAQLIALQDGSGYRLVNLGDTHILLGEQDDSTVPPRSVAAVADGSVLRIGDFTLVFHGNAPLTPAVPTTAAKSDANIGLHLLLSDTQLAPNQMRSGTLIVSNQGDRSGVQFDLKLEGLDDDCFSLEPTPLLSSGSEAEVVFRLYHRGTKPLAGEHTVTIRATAPQAYPGEEAMVTYTLQVQPYYRHSLQPAAVPVAEPTPPQPTPRSTHATATPIARASQIDAQRAPEPDWTTPETALAAPVAEAQTREPAGAMQQSPESEPEAAPPPATADRSLPEVLPIVDETEDAATPFTPAQAVEPTESDEETPEAATTAVRSEEAPTADSDWWSEAAGESEPPQVLTLKAPPPPKVAATTDTPPATGSDDWWSEPETDASPSG